MRLMSLAQYMINRLLHIHVALAKICSVKLNSIKQMVHDVQF